MELTVVMPCLNKAEAVASRVRKAVIFAGAHLIDGEVIVNRVQQVDPNYRPLRSFYTKLF